MSNDWIELEQEKIQREVAASVTKVQEIPFYPAHWWRWEIRSGNVSIMLSQAEAEHFAHLVMGEEVTVTLPKSTIAP